MLPQDSEFRQWEAIENMVYKIANKVHQRVQGAGLQSRMSLDDLIQEGALTWITAMEKFDPEYGIKFTTYLYRALNTNINRYVTKHGNIKGDKTLYYDSFDQPLTEDTNSSRHELIEGSAVYPPDVFIEAAQAIEQDRNKLSKKARIVYDLFLDPPKWLREEILAAKEQARLKREQRQRPGGVAPTDMVVIGMVVKTVWGMSDRDYKAIRSEIWRVGNGN